MPVKILIVQLRQLGDILLTTPVLSLLRRDLPEARLFFLCHRMGLMILRDNPMIERVYTYNDNDSLTTQLRLISSLRKEKFDGLIDFMNNPRSAFLTLASRTRIRVGIQSKRSLAYNIRVARGDSSEYIVNQKLRVTQNLVQKIIDSGLQDNNKCSTQTMQKESNPLLPMLPFEKNDAALAFDFLKKVASDKIRIILSPTHRRSERRWPLKFYAQISDLFLAQESDCCVLWLWGPGEEDMIDEGLSLCRIKAVKTPQTSFREMAALIANCDLFIGNSNGPSHVAVATITPSIQIHGPTDPRSWCPMSKIHKAVCSPRDHSEKSNIGAITVDQVYMEWIKIKEETMNKAPRHRQKFVLQSEDLLNKDLFEKN